MERLLGTEWNVNLAVILGKDEGYKGPMSQGLPAFCFSERCCGIISVFRTSVPTQPAPMGSSQSLCRESTIPSQVPEPVSPGSEGGWGQDAGRDAGPDGDPLCFSDLGLPCDQDDAPFSPEWGGPEGPTGCGGHGSRDLVPHGFPREVRKTLRTLKWKCRGRGHGDQRQLL